MSLSDAKRLYNRGRYVDCIEMCTELMDKNELSSEVFTLSAKSVVGLASYPIKDNEKEIILSAIKNAVGSCISVKEVFDVRYEIGMAFQKWRKEVIQKALQNLSSDFSVEGFKKYSDIKFISFTHALALPGNVKVTDRPDLLEKEGLGKEAAETKYIRHVDSVAFDNEIKQMEFELVKNTFSNLVTYIENNGDGNADFCGTVATTALNCIAVLDLLCSSFTPKEEDGLIPPEIIVERMFLHAQILTFKMDGMLCCYGRECSFFLGDDLRQQTYNKIKALYSSILQYDPDFQTPPMPRLYGIYPQAPTNTSDSTSGGCYVATAVYGSYDCPQVWTLRRYRDKRLAKTWHGRAFIKTYYAISPTLVKLFGQSEWFKKFWRGKLDKFVAKLQLNGFESTPYEY